MLSRKTLFGMLVIIVALIPVLIGCTTITSTGPAPAPQRPDKYNDRVSWSEYLSIPDKNYIVVGIITVRNVDSTTLTTDLMEKAAAIGAHGIINVRVDAERIERRRRLVAASAVAIRYTNETLAPEIQAILYKSRNTTPAEASSISSASQGSVRYNERVSWSEYLSIPIKDYTVVGIVTARDVDPSSLSTDLMEKAAAIGAHDIINVWVDAEERMEDGRRVIAASAVAIKYSETLPPEIYESLHTPENYTTSEVPSTQQQQSRASRLLGW